MMLDENRKRVALELLEKGYIKLNENNFKDYLDGFTMSYLNGLYYSENGFNINYSLDRYIDFLHGKSNMSKFEKEEHLGYLKRPIKKGN